MNARLQISEWLEGEPAGQIATPTPRDTARPAPEPPSALHCLRRRLESRLTTARELLRSREREDRPAPALPTSLPGLDRLLGGGLARGELVELVGRRSSGRFSLVLAILAAATGVGEAAALVDLGDGFDPASAAAAGADLELLLWLRPHRVREALAGAEMLVGAGFPLVVVDLGAPPLAGGRGAQGAWLRLARAARDHRAALLVSAPYRVSGTAAAAVLGLRGRSLRRRDAPRAPLLFLGLDTRISLEKARGRAPGETEDLCLCLSESRVHATPGPRSDRRPAALPRPGGSTAATPHAVAAGR